MERPPLIIAVLDGIGIGNLGPGDAVHAARTPTLDRLMSRPGMFRSLLAHGPHVGLPTLADMGNSEVGHNALGCGVVHDQGASLVDRALKSGSLYEEQVWQEIVGRCQRDGGALHFVGLLSDGNVHSHIDHLIAMLRRAARDGVQRLFVHILTDGRDVPATSSLTYVDQLESVLAELSASGVTAAIASGGGRMFVTMDRYEADWSIVERGWRAHVLGDARRFGSAREAIETFRSEQPGISDQDLPPFVIRSGGTPSGSGGTPSGSGGTPSGSGGTPSGSGGTPMAPIRCGDCVINFNFRGDRAIEISRAFEDESFTDFDRVRRPDVLYAGMMQYDGDLQLPLNFLVCPPKIENTMGEFLVREGVTQLAISETQKYGHVTYFWNGNRSGAFDDTLETYVEIESDRVSFDTRPDMKAVAITERLLAELQTGRYQCARLNYANGDMVGHTGNYEATVRAVEVVDQQLARLVAFADDVGAHLVVTADHGNADEMYQLTKTGEIIRDFQTEQPVAKTSHTLNRVPFALYGGKLEDRYSVVTDAEGDFGIANVTATCLELLGLSVPPQMEPSLLRSRS